MTHIFGVRLGLLATFVLLAGNAFGQAEEKEPSAILKRVGLRRGPERWFKFSDLPWLQKRPPIPDVLELEGGVTTLFQSRPKRMGCRFPIQKALYSVRYRGIYGWRWAGMGTRRYPKRHYRHSCRRSGHSILCSGRGRVESSASI